jgi:Xaa-Pro aminopeptidase
MEFTDAPADLDEVRLYRLQRYRDQLRNCDVAGGLLFDQINTRYVTDATNMQVWCSHYETRCVFVATEGPVVLFDYANVPHLAEGLPTVDDYRVNSSFYFFTAGSRSAERAQQFAAEIADLVATHGGGNKRLAVDRLSVQGVDCLRACGIEIVDGLPLIEHARAIKSPGELALMEASIAVCEQGMRTMYEVLQPGITENALWATLHETNIRLGGEWIETRLLSSGPRTNPWFRECSMRAIQEGDLVCFDTDLIGPYGYCADISRAWVCGRRASAEQRTLFALSQEQILHNTEVLAPGKSFSEVSEQAWRIPEPYAGNRYSSLIHGVGLADEYPSIKHWPDWEKRGYDGMLEPGMTLCVESYIGAVGGDQGVKLEEQVLITETGTRTLSTYPLDLD